MQLIRQGATAGRVELTGRRGTVPVAVSVGLSATEPKRARLDGAVLRSAEQLRSELATLVFTPDRLVVVKGGPAARRAYIDRSLGRLYPARAHVSIDYGAAVGPAERRPAPRRAGRLRAGRARAVDGAGRGSRGDARRGPARRDRAAAAELRRARGRARPRRRLARLRRGAADDHAARGAPRRATSSGARPASARTWTRSRSSSGDRDLRTFGSQGEQRLAVLALLLAEAELIGDAPPRAAAAPPRRRALRARREPPPDAE